MFDVFFQAFTISTQTTAMGSVFEISGGVTSDCFGGMVTLSTAEGLSLLFGNFCPAEGQLVVVGLGEVFYLDGAVTVAPTGGDPEMYNSCTDPELLVCVQ